MIQPMQCHYEHVGTESFKKVTLRLRILVASSPGPGIHCLRMRQNENYQLFLVIGFGAMEEPAFEITLRYALECIGKQSLALK